MKIFELAYLSLKFLGNSPCFNLCPKLTIPVFLHLSNLRVNEAEWRDYNNNCSNSGPEITMLK